MNFRKIALVLVAFLGLSEVAVRLLGLTDFPIYRASSTLGYIPLPNQKGAYLNKNDWQFNSKSMGAPEFMPSNKKDVLLVGDSIVLGGNPYKQSDRLASRLNELGRDEYKFWPISAGSWALQNELAYLNENPDVVQNVDEIWFVLNGEDFGLPSSWACNLTHPKEKPPSALIYLFQKFVLPFERCDTPDSATKVKPQDPRKMLADFLGKQKRPVKFFLYSNKKQFEDVRVDEEFKRSSVSFLKAAGASNISEMDRRAWKLSFYRDNIHPTPEGAKILAGMIFVEFR